MLARGSVVIDDEEDPVAATEPADLPARLRRVLSTDPDATGLLFAGREYPWAYLGGAAAALDELASGGGSGSCCATARARSRR
jgi:hypothetical protein